MYAALIPDRIRPIIDPIAHKNILMSPSFVPETLKAFKKHHTEAANADAEMMPKVMDRIRSRFTIKKSVGFRRQEIYKIVV
jgi:hypothetical protein